MESYSKPLNDKIKYVQYIPKDVRENLEDAVNQLYKDHEPGQDEANKQKDPSKKKSRINWDSHAKGEGNRKGKHDNDRRKVRRNDEETDLAILQSKAFKHLLLQKPFDEPTGFDSDRICRASFYPRSKLPYELMRKLE